MVFLEFENNGLEYQYNRNMNVKLLVSGSDRHDLEEIR